MNELAGNSLQHTTLDMLIEVGQLVYEADVFRVAVVFVALVSATIWLLGVGLNGIGDFGWLLHVAFRHE